MLGYTGEVDTPPGCGLTALTLSEPARSSKGKMGSRGFLRETSVPHGVQGIICCRMNERSLAFTMWAALVPPGRKAQLNNTMVTVLEGDQLQIKPGGRSTRNKPHLSKTIHPLTLSFIQPSIH